MSQGGYKAFLPTQINDQWLMDDPELDQLVSEAHVHLGQLKTYAHLLPAVDYFIHMHKAKEATTSSMIEGTQTQVVETFLTEKGVDPERRDDWHEVQNYIAAMNYAMEATARIAPLQPIDPRHAQGIDARGTGEE